MKKLLDPRPQALIRKVWEEDLDPRSFPQNLESWIQGREVWREAGLKQFLLESLNFDSVCKHMQIFGHTACTLVHSSWLSSLTPPIPQDSHGLLTSKPGLFFGPLKSQPSSAAGLLDSHNVWVECCYSVWGTYFLPAAMFTKPLVGQNMALTKSTMELAAQGMVALKQNGKATISLVPLLQNN